ncbi:thiamine-repressible mitochondrial transport protein THI74-like [Impatiens glandulifera]|uniref:thiamine-repressible mitochondrial transport protein THI74-like n=1 Tax=Impatiens glandulifera TaxID=253017 RepID=UPI001FB131CD|nr:thiamine-repressible mitochondrial transport protein THI74-like [Impatiens glandulifera]
MNNQSWRWTLGLVYLFVVAAIWIAASFVIQAVVDGGVSPFLLTYMGNSLFVIYIPLVEMARYLEDVYGSVFFWRKRKEVRSQTAEPEAVILLQGNGNDLEDDDLNPRRPFVQEKVKQSTELGNGGDIDLSKCGIDKGLDSKGRWTRIRVAKASLVICPFWFLAQLTFNLSLQYTTVTSNTILSSSSSLFTFLVSLSFLGEKFTWLKFFSVLLCMGGTVIVSLGDTEAGQSPIASNPAVGDTLAIISSAIYAVYIALIRVKLPDDDGKNCQASMGQFLGYLGLFNILLFFPVALILEITKLESYNMLTWKQIGLIVGNGLIDNVLSDYLWAKSVLLTNPTVATAGLTIQVPMAAIVDTATGNAPKTMDIVGAVAVMVGFAGMNIPPGAFSSSKEPSIELGIRDHKLSQPKSTTT